MGFFGSDSNATATDNRQAGTDQAVVNRQGNDGTTASGASLALGKNAKLQTGKNAKDLSNSKGSGNVLKGNVTAGDKSTVTITSSDPSVTKDAINSLSLLSTQFGQTLSDFASRSADASAASQTGTTTALAANAQTLTEALSKIGSGQQTQVATDAASTATGGVSNFTKPAIILGLALLAVVAFIFWSRK